MIDKIGVIAEDDTDCRTIEVLAQRIRNTTRNIKKRAAGGCAHLRDDAERWMRELAARGCSRIILVHDLDRSRERMCLNDEASLHRHLSAFEIPKGVTPLICIPVEEIEAWFWSDAATVRRAIRSKKLPRVPVNPESIKQPKEALERASKDGGKIPLYSTNDNPRLAKDLNMDLCARKCKSFRTLRDFVLAA